ncbi:hypothetical protein ASPTUDRAFT_62102 [Aspergillus tubingensis CBS 134.48]|uniref:Carboxypeptidase n=1 Tax=Aspergillus tubingensis (strain CBS 134.48) TaxID=767770 RepID=A0A1L9NDS8_ASPTC|nr:hypothetical protein ASPTUDRAFT_62102 [Aspergillus tubingensis CBS 134.48]
MKKPHYDVRSLLRTISCALGVANAVNAPTSPVGTSINSADSHEPAWNTFSGDDFTVRSRRTSPNICSGQQGISGYVDWIDNHMYFLAFESRNNPEKDPVILWLSGGPGTSSVGFGAMLELGPCIPDYTIENPYSWNQNATIIFVDQPLSVGYSYGSRNISNLEDATNDLYDFLTRLFAARSDWGQRDFYIAGESYGGSYVPALAAKIDEMQSSELAKLVAATSSCDLSNINLKGVMIGNGLIDDHLQRRGTYEMGCTDKGSGSILNETQCFAIAEAASRCEKLEEACRKSGYSPHVCKIHPGTPYDVRINCTAEPELCIDPPSGLVDWMSSPAVRSGFGIDDSAGKFTINGEVGYPSHDWVTQLLDKEFRVLIYAGDTDWLCTADGMRYLVDNLRWRGTSAFRALPFTPLHGNKIGVQSRKNDVVGYYKQYCSLTFVEVHQAGHMVPADQPEVSLAMINRWIDGGL